MAECVQKIFLPMTLSSLKQSKSPTYYLDGIGQCKKKLGHEYPTLWNLLCARVVLLPLCTPQFNSVSIPKLETQENGKKMRTCPPIFFNLSLLPPHILYKTSVSVHS